MIYFMNQNETLELGICLLPNDRVSEKISLYSQEVTNKFCLDYNLHNIPHVGFVREGMDGAIFGRN